MSAAGTATVLPVVTVGAQAARAMSAAGTIAEPPETTVGAEAVRTIPEALETTTFAPPAATVGVLPCTAIFAAAGRIKAPEAIEGA